MERKWPSLMDEKLITMRYIEYSEHKFNNLDRIYTKIGIFWNDIHSYAFVFECIGIENWFENRYIIYSNILQLVFYSTEKISPYSSKFLGMTLLLTSGLHIFLNTPLISIGEVTSFLKNYILCGKAIATEIRYKRICKTRSEIFSLLFSSVFDFIEREF